MPRKRTLVQNALETNLGGDIRRETNFRATHAMKTNLKATHALALRE